MVGLPLARLTLSDRIWIPSLSHLDTYPVASLAGQFLPLRLRFEAENHQALAGTIGGVFSWFTLGSIGQGLMAFLSVRSLFSMSDGREFLSLRSQFRGAKMVSQGSKMRFGCLVKKKPHQSVKNAHQRLTLSV